MAISIDIFNKIKASIVKKYGENIICHWRLHIQYITDDWGKRYLSDIF